MEQKQHICFISQNFPRRDSLIVYRQGKSLVESGFKVSYIVCDGKPDEVRYGIEIKSISVSYCGFWYKMASIEPHIKRHYERWFKIHKLKQYLIDYDADLFQINDFEIS